MTTIEVKENLSLHPPHPAFAHAHVGPLPRGRGELAADHFRQFETNNRRGHSIPSPLGGEGRRERSDRGVRGAFGPARALTLVEVLITLVIFVLLAGFMMLAVREVVTQWGLGERRRVLYEKAAGVLDLMATDVRLVATQEPAGVGEVIVRFIGDVEKGTGKQRMMFVRSFEAGPERAITFNNGDGRFNDMEFKPPDGAKPVAPAKIKNVPDTDNYTGLKVGDFKPLKGLAMVGYFENNQILYRAIRAPVQGSMTALIQPTQSQALATDVLYLSFDYWSQNTQTWDEQPPQSKTFGPEKIWDSTRGIDMFPLNKFSLHRDRDSLNDPEDDVFPEMVRITLTVDSSMPRCIYTKLLNEIGDIDGVIEVDSVKGFEDGGLNDSYIRIDDEWMHYKQKSEGKFVLDRRGARGTLAKGHLANAIVRTGKTFRRIVYVPNWREDLTPDDVYAARKAASNSAVRLQP